MIFKTGKFRLILALLSISLVSCSSISLYDQHAYETSTSLKVDVLNMMNNGTGEYSKYESQIMELLVAIEKAYEYEKGRPKNSISTKMWEKMKDPNGGLFGEFIILWGTQGTLSQVYVIEKKKIVGEAFDDMIELESKKIKAE
jgi:hypothetical protein